MEILFRHPYVSLFLLVLVEQLGLPLPADPLLLAVGAMAAEGRVRFPLIVAVALTATLLSDNAWYEAGRRRGSAVLKLLCRISLEPDSCVRQAQVLFARHGVRTLLVCKFIPGLAAVAPPLAGIFGMRRIRFVLFAGAGALLWIVSIEGIGYVFGRQLELAVLWASRFVGGVTVLVATLLACYLIYKYAQRRRFMRSLRIARITPQELKRKLEAGEDLVVVDLRSSLDFEAEPEVIPGALRLPADELEERHGEIPREREVILYCT
jgi:membrane protein DedA with SNARE-associated domain